LRVDDHPDPVAEIARLLRLKRAQNAQRQFAEAAAAGRIEEAAAALHQALELAPEVHEIQLSAAYAYVLHGRHDEARALLRRVFDSKPLLAEWMHRMIAAGIIPHNSVLVDTIASMRIRSAAH
jgi:thioredoxin-like negative regulator of GroEL